MSNSAVGFHSHFAYKITTSGKKEKKILKKANMKSNYSQIPCSVGAMLFRASSIAQTKDITE